MRVEQAYVSTLGHEVVDTFYVTAPDGTKLTDPEVVAARGCAARALWRSTAVVRFRSG